MQLSKDKHTFPKVSNVSFYCLLHSIAVFEKSAVGVITIYYAYFCVAQLVKNLPAVPEALVQSLGWEGPLEKGKAVFWHTFITHKISIYLEI